MLTCKLVTVASSLKLCIWVIVVLKFLCQLCPKFICFVFPWFLCNFHLKRKTERKKEPLNFSESEEIRKPKLENRMVPGLAFDWTMFFFLERRKVWQSMSEELRIKHETHDCAEAAHTEGSAANSTCSFVPIWQEISIKPSNSVKLHVVPVTSSKSAADACFLLMTSNTLRQLTCCIPPRQQ